MNTDLKQNDETESVTMIGMSVVQMEETVSKAEETASNTEETVSKVEETVSKVEETTKLLEVKEPEVFLPKYKEVFGLIVLILASDERFNELVSKAKIILTDAQAKEIKNILSYLNTETNGLRPIDPVVEEVIKALSDNKLELYEIPTIINVIHESLKNLSSIKISTSDVGVLIKYILVILIESKQITLSNEDFDLVSRLIDTSVLLLNKSVEIKLPKQNKCFCF